jgi:O-antigen ligase
MTDLWLCLGVIGLVCLAGFAAWFPAAATGLWILALETSPDMWLASLIGGHETIIGVLKAAGAGLALVMGLRFGFRRDRYNPGFAFVAMFGAGLAHGLYPGLTLLSSLRSLLGSAVPFLFSFSRLPEHWRRAVVLAVTLGPLWTVGFGLVLSALGLHQMYVFEQDALRLGASGEPSFLAGFTLIAIYAGLMELLARGSRADFLLLAINFMILLLTGARAPLALAVLLMLVTLLLPEPRLTLWSRLMLLAGGGALASISVLLISRLSFVRVVDLTRLGEAGNLSNRGLIWPFFERAIAASPWFGWGVGAGKLVVPVNSDIGSLIGTNAAHNEYLRIGVEGGFTGLALLVVLLALWCWRGSQHLPRPQRLLMRLVFLAFAAHSATDNTLIATTSSVFFIWVSAVFAAPQQPAESL